MKRRDRDAEKDYLWTLDPWERRIFISLCIFILFATIIGLYSNYCLSRLITSIIRLEIPSFLLMPNSILDSDSKAQYCANNLAVRTIMSNKLSFKADVNLKVVRKIKLKLRFPRLAVSLNILSQTTHANRQGKKLNPIINRCFGILIIVSGLRGKIQVKINNQPNTCRKQLRGNHL